MCGRLKRHCKKDEQRNFNFLQPKRLCQTLSRTLRRRNLFSRKTMSACRNAHEMSFEEKKTTITIIVTFNLYSAVPTAQNILINFAHYQEINNRLTENFPLLCYARSLISVTVYALSCLLRIKRNTLQVICLCLKEYRWRNYNDIHRSGIVHLSSWYSQIRPTYLYPFSGKNMFF